MKKINNLNSSGQASTEAAVMLLTMSLIVTLFFAITYVIYASYWTEHILYESVICYEETGLKILCQKEGRDKISNLLPFHRDIKIFLKKIQNSYTVQTEFDVTVPTEFGNFSKRTFQFEKSVRF